MTFLQELSVLLAARAARVRVGDPDFASLDLAAHLLAAATYLRERHGDARMDTDQPLAAADLDEAVEIAKKISSSDPVEAYLDACGALIGIDASFDPASVAEAPSLPKQTMLQPLQDQGRIALFGTVQHWIRPRSPWRAARDYRENEAPHVNIYPSTPAEQLDTLDMIWDRGELPEARPVRLRDLPATDLAGFRIVLCPLFCDGHPRFTVSPEGNRFTIDTTDAYLNPAALAEHLAILAPQLESSEVQLLVLPELSVTEAARTQVAEMLIASRCMVGIVSGSFHIWRDGHPVPLNEAIFHVPGGIAWEHHKLGHFRVTPRDIARFGAFFTPPLPELKPRVVEGIRWGSVLQFWDTRIGRIAILICADAIARESMMPAVERCHPDIVLVPSLSTETAVFERLGESLARRGISTFYVNAASAFAGNSSVLAAFAHIALPTPPGAPLSRIRWPPSSAPEALDFASRSWVAAAPEHVQLLENNAGIVIDLGQHLSWRAITDPGRPANKTGARATESV